MMKKTRALSLALLFALVPVLFGWAQTKSSLPPGQAEGLQPILGYIDRGWDSLTRSLDKCETVTSSQRVNEPVLYLPFGLPVPAAVRELQKNCSVRVEHLPQRIQKPGEIDPAKTFRQQGLLYLEHPYVVPGGMFNEMYGWDSYFILLGLLRDGKIDLAQGMVENFLFEIEHYGMILNANRTHFLSRSQPPFLTSMALAVYEAQKARGREDRAWLEKAYRYAVRDYEFWTREPHLAGTTGLSRYYDFGEGPGPEVLAGADAYYRYVVGHFLRHPESAGRYLVVAQDQKAQQSPIGPHFTVYVCNPSDKSPRAEDCELATEAGLTSHFYKGDRSMRESGFDISFRFGPFSADTHEYAPVCLNSLLYKAEKDLEQISSLLGRADEAKKWGQRAQERRERVQKYLWDGERGLFFDYNIRTGARSNYEYASTFYPLWAGLASPEQARAVARNLSLFEQAGGLAMSRQETKVQWDYPYGWAPNQLIAVEGLRRYGYDEDANRLAFKFLGTVMENFRRDGTIREKYNVVTRSSETQIAAGYRENVIGFGWTNGVFLELLHGLPADWKQRLASQ